MLARLGAVTHATVDTNAADLEAQQALRLDRPPSALSYATAGTLPATQGQR